MVNEPSVEDTISILRGLRERYELHHHVRIQDAALVAAAQLSNRYITDRFLPDKAIDLIDEAAAKLRTEMESMPEELESLERRLMQLEIEREALKKEKDEASRDRLGSLEQQIAEEHLAREVYDPVYGARPLKRFLQRAIETPLSRQLISGEITDHTRVAIEFKNGELTFAATSIKGVK